MKLNNEFIRTDNHTVTGSKGVSVELTGPFALVYREKNRSIKFKIDNTFALDVVLTYLLYPPLHLVWRETGEHLTEQEFITLRRNIVEELKLFNGIALFITPKELSFPTVRASSQETSYVH